MEDNGGVRSLLGPTKNLRESQFGLDQVWRDVSQLKRVSAPRRALQLISLAWRSFLVSPFTSLMTLLSISVILTFFALFVVVLHNFSGLVSDASQNEVVLRLFLQDSVDQGKISDLKSNVSKFDGVSSVKVISRSDALDEFKKTIGEDSDILNGLAEQNPLPASIEIKFALSDALDMQIKNLADKFKDHPDVLRVVYSQNLVGQISGVLSVLQRAGGVALAILLAITAFIITVTIRLAVHSHRQEISIMRLVGASSTFVRAPFIIEGVFQGLIGSIVSLAVVQIGVGYLLSNDSILGLQNILQIDLSRLPTYWLCSILVLGPCLGVVGSYLAVRKIDDN